MKITKVDRQANEPGIGDRVEVWGGHCVRPSGKVDHMAPWKRVRLWVDAVAIQNGDIVVSGPNRLGAQRVTVGKWDPETSRVIIRSSN